jgi:hypothetical protein
MKKVEILQKKIKMWQKWAHAVGKIPPVDLLKEGLQQNFSL